MNTRKYCGEWIRFSWEILQIRVSASVGLELYEKNIVLQFQFSVSVCYLFLFGRVFLKVNISSSFVKCLVFSWNAWLLRDTYVDCVQNCVRFLFQVFQDQSWFLVFVSIYFPWLGLNKEKKVWVVGGVSFHQISYIFICISSTRNMRIGIWEETRPSLFRTRDTTPDCWHLSDADRMWEMQLDRFELHPIWLCGWGGWERKSFLEWSESKLGEKILLNSDTKKLRRERFRCGVSCVTVVAHFGISDSWSWRIFRVGSLSHIWDDLRQCHVYL